MASLTDTLHAGDIIAVRTGGTAGFLIRLGAAFLDRPNMDNHIAVAHHLDQSGKFWWLLEGRPGGVGWADSRRYDVKFMVNNCAQPGRAGADRAAVADKAKAMIGTAYDWQAIADDTLKAFHMPELWASSWQHGVAPAQVVCSSFAAFLYEWKGWARPATDGDRDTTPGDWTGFCLSNNYHVPVN